MAHTRIKICCISSIEEAELAIDAGADALGFVGPMPSGAGITSLENIHDIIKKLPIHIRTVLLTSAQSPQKISKELHFTQANALQLVDYQPIETLQYIRKKHPHITLIQVIHVQNEANILQAKQIEPFVDEILLDSGNPSLGLKELGGTGKTHNWTISRQIQMAIDKPLWLAGGLSAVNVQEAIEQVKPQGVDVCSGVRFRNKLNNDMLQSFVKVVRIK